MRFSAKDAVVTVGQQTRIAASVGIEPREGKSNTDFTLLLAPVTLAAGTSQQVALTIERRCGATCTGRHRRRGRALRDAARRWWETSNLPFETIQIPDAGIQAMIESCVRNIWQAREIKGGKPAFHVGPTCYRGLWIVDGSFLLESAAILNRAQDARAGSGIHAEPPKAGRQLRDSPTLLEGERHRPLGRHASCRLDAGQDCGSARSGRRSSVRSKRSTTCEPRRSRIRQLPNYGLLPAGDVDGGIGNRDAAEYSNTEWCLTGLKAAIAAAHWLGDEQSALAWQKEYDDFYAAFRKAAARDTLADKFGNAYVPTMMGNAGKHHAAERAMGLLPRGLSRPGLPRRRSAGGGPDGHVAGHEGRGAWSSTPAG